MKPKTCEGCKYAIHCEETDEYTYNSMMKACNNCFRSGWEDSYEPKDKQ